MNILISVLSGFGLVFIISIIGNMIMRIKYEIKRYKDNQEILKYVDELLCKKSDERHSKYGLF